MNRCESMGRYISILYRLSNTYFSKEFSKFNIGSGQFPFLSYVYNHDGVSQEDISHGLNIDKATTARAIKKLEEEGYVKRYVDKDDKRAYKVYVTNKALDIKDEFYAILNSWNEIISFDFTEEEKDITLKLLKRMVDNQNKLLRKENNNE